MSRNDTLDTCNGCNPTPAAPSRCENFFIDGLDRPNCNLDDGNLFLLMREPRLGLAGFGADCGILLFQLTIETNRKFLVLFSGLIDW